MSVHWLLNEVSCFFYQNTYVELRNFFEQVRSFKNGFVALINTIGFDRE